MAVCDVSDDVRRSAVTYLGFILFRSPVQVPKLVSRLAESFTSYVRYGAYVPVGVALAIQLLKPKTMCVKVRSWLRPFLLCRGLKAATRGALIRFKF